MAYLTFLCRDGDESICRIKRALGLAHDRSPRAYLVTQALFSDCPTHHVDDIVKSGGGFKAAQHTQPTKGRPQTLSFSVDFHE